MYAPNVMASSKDATGVSNKREEQVIMEHKKKKKKR